MDKTPLPIPAAHAPEVALRVDVHDRSRLEWVAQVPLAPAGQSRAYEITMEADVPDAMWVPHQPWDHFQVRSRLTSPVLTPGHRMVGPSIDQLRRRALSAAHDLKTSTHDLLRQLRQARKRDGLLRADEAEATVQRLRTVLQRASDARETFDYLRDADDSSLEREQKLADEYVSTHILMLVTRVAGTVAGGRPEGRKPSRHKKRGRPPLGGEIGPVQAALREALEREQAHRESIGLRLARVRTMRDVEAFVGRAAQLKKHFQQALFLDARAYMLDQRLRNWIAAVVAMIASTFYFVWQIWILNAAMSTAQTTVSLVLAGTIAALVYAAKDRIKEVGRDWLSIRLKHSYADRVAHLSLQKRMDPDETEFALAREAISLSKRFQPDPLNPGLGRTQLVHHIRVRERLKHTGLKILHDQGLSGLKHVFRYDLSPLLHKLDDHIKRVPVLAAGRVRTVGATRVYAIPISVRMQELGTSAPPLVQRGLLLVRRRGLERFVPLGEQRTATVAPHLVGGGSEWKDLPGLPVLDGAIRKAS